MDLIYTDRNRRDLGVLLDAAFDMAFGADENDFLCTVDMNSHCCTDGCFLYMEGTEFGGMIDEIDVDTDSRTVSYYGRTWHGILAGKVLCPDPGEDYLVVSGEANAVMGQLIERMGLLELFEASGEDSGLVLRAYSMNRYVDAYTGIRKMLSTVSGKLNIAYNGQKAVLRAAAAVDYSQDEEWDSSQIGFKIARNSNPVNHMICLGKGELAQRQVVHLYADRNGVISGSQSLSGPMEVTGVYDNANAESLEELEKGGREKLEEAYCAAASLQISFDGTQEYDIGDKVGAREEVTGLYIVRPIVKKIVTVNKNGMNIEYKVGE